jgi:RNA polymerase sigma-70 factor (ECF subfamily)
MWGRRFVGLFRSHRNISSDSERALLRAIPPSAPILPADGSSAPHRPPPHQAVRAWSTAFQSCRHRLLANGNSTCYRRGVPPITTGTTSRDAGHFEATRWSIVVAAGGTDSERAQKALEHLCSAYWYPLYAFIRRHGHDPHDAQDLTQEFFARLLAKNYLGTADPEKGRFRSFLLGALKHFLASEWDRARAAKRGGGQQLISLDAESAETRYKLEPTDDAPEKNFERQWALTLLEQVLARLRGEFVREGKEPLFEEFKSALTGRKMPYGEIAERLSLKEGAVRVAVHRLRQRYKELVRAEIAETVESPAEVDSEMQHLFAALGA